MAARLINKEDVAEACKSIVASGEQPTTVKIHKILGKGSFSTIQKFILLWKESDEARDIQLEQLPAVVQLPAEFLEGSESFLKSIYQLAEQQHASKVVQIKADSEQLINTARDEAQESVEYAESIGEENEQLKEQVKLSSDRVTDLEKENGGLLRKVEATEQDNTELSTSLADAEASIKQLTESLSKYKTDLALSAQSLEQSKSELMKVESNHSSTILTMKTDHNSAISELKSDHDKAILDHNEKINLLKSDHDSELSELKLDHKSNIAEIKTVNKNAINELKLASKDLADMNAKALSLSEMATADAQKQRDEAIAKATTKKATVKKSTTKK